MKWIDKHLEISKPTKPKKITGTRFSKVLHKNVWNTDFEAWCDITRVNPIPFEDNESTIAGKIIEPKTAEYLKNKYGMRIFSPTDMYGDDYFNKTRGDFFPEHPIFGGMWDFLQLDRNDEIVAVLEMKTTKRSEDWLENIPEYYSLQVALYCYLLGVDRAIVVTSILEPKDYKDPDKFIPTSDNTFIRSFKVSEKYPNFNELLDEAIEWWNKYVLTGISPDYDLSNKGDKEIIEALRTKNLSPNTDFSDVLSEAESLQVEINVNKYLISDKEKRLKELLAMIKEKALSEMGADDKKAVITGKQFEWTISKFKQATIDKKKLEQDGLLDKYLIEKTIEKLTVKARKE